MARPMNAKEFGAAMRITVPKELVSRGRAVYFDVATQLHEAIAVETPVDTGYLRSSLLASEAGEAPPAIEPRQPDTHYSAGQADGTVSGAIAQAVARLRPITIGFLAEYAPYVEDRRHMVKNAKLRIKQFIDIAVRNARAGRSANGGGTRGGAV